MAGHQLKKSVSGRFLIQSARALSFLAFASCTFSIAPTANASLSLDQYLPALTDLSCRYVEWDPSPVDGSLNISREAGLRAAMEMKVSEDRKVRLGAVDIEIKDRRLVLTTVQTEAAKGLGTGDSTRSATIGRRAFLNPQQSGPNAMNKDNLPFKSDEVDELAMSAYSIVSWKSEAAPGGGTKFTTVRRMFRIACLLN